MDNFPLTEYSCQNFRNIDATVGAHPNRSFTDCIFEKCVFDKTDFTGSILAGCRFTHCEFVTPKLIRCGLREIAFQNCKLVGVDFSRCTVNFFELAFADCLLDTCNFAGLNLKNTPFMHCIVRDSIFQETDLEKTDFKGSDLEKTLFHHCDLRKADFTGARNYTIDPSTNKLAGSKFSLPEAVGLLHGLGIKLE